MHPSVADRLARLAPDQRAAATALPGPTLCVAPAGSGKTTTLIARVAWLIDSGQASVDEIAAITFNKRAAEELVERLEVALAPLGVGRDEVRVRTFHALGREVLGDAGLPVEPLVDRMALLRRVAPTAGAAGWRVLDTAISRLKLDLGVSADDVAADPGAGPLGRAFIAYEGAVAATGGLDFDDLVARALVALEADPILRERWHARCLELLVDEAQDLDRAQLRMALLLAAPANRIFLVGDDDQSIYGWRLADVRRVLSLDDALEGLRRVDLEVNYRCPPSVVDRAVRLIGHNKERFTKVIRAGPAASGPLILAADSSDELVRVDRVMASWPDDGGTRAVLARTNRELLPAIAVALDRRMAFRPPAAELLVGSPVVDQLLAEAGRTTDPALPLPARLEAIRARWADSSSAASTTPENEDADPDAPQPADIAAAALAWSVPFPTLEEFREAIAERRAAILELCRDDAALTLATAHGTKGLEFDHVAVIGLDEGRFPSRRSIMEAVDPQRALEEERRLAYVAWTRARRSLTLLYDPIAPSTFLYEAFSAGELAPTTVP